MLLLKSTSGSGSTGLIPLLCLALVLSGCRTPGSFYWEEYTDVFDANGRVENHHIRKDRPFVVQILERYHCRFPLILDPDKNCQHLRYGEECCYTAIGAICDEKGRSLGGSIIGTRQSFFDSEFINAKRELAWRNK